MQDAHEKVNEIRIKVIDIPNSFEEFFNDPDINEDEITGDLPVEIVAINELNAYKRLRTLPIKDNKNKYNDPLEWWKINELAMPFLAKLARKTRNVPATSAPSERVFSSAGIDVNKRRARIRNDIIEATVFLHGCRDRVEAYLRDSNGEGTNRRARVQEFTEQQCG